MRWSSLKKTIEQERICDALRGRVELHSTSYRETYAYLGRWWIMVDGERVFSGYTSRESGEYWVTTSAGDDSCEAGAAAFEVREKKGRSAAEDFQSSLAEFLDASIEDALGSPDPVIRSLALLDRRTGKRRLKRIEIAGNDHPLVRYFYRLRCESERLDAAASPERTEND